MADADDRLALLPADKQLVFLLSRNDRFSAATYLAMQLGGHAVALLDGTKPPASHLDVHGGIMVTASHNPMDYNGMKLVREEARPISGDTAAMVLRPAR